MAKPVNWTAPSPLPRERRAGPDLDALAALALGFLAEDPERVQRFLALTGFDPAGLRRAAADAGFGRAVMTYLCEDEALLVAFATQVGQSPERIGALVRARAEQEAWPGD